MAPAANNGTLYSVIAALLIRRESLNKVINESNRIWNKYLPGIPFTEFHASELENATKWPFSTLRNDQPLQMQKELINILSFEDLPTVAVTVNGDSILLNPFFVGSSDQPTSMRE